MRKLSYTEAEFKKSVAYKKGCISLVPLMIPPRSWCERVFNLFFVPTWISSCFCVNGKKISFSRSDFVDSEIVIWGLTSATDFYKSVQLLFKKQYVSDCQKKISYIKITHLIFTFLTLDDIKSYYQYPTSCKIAPFYLKLTTRILASVN